MEGGIDDVRSGCVLFGLDKYRYEFAGLLMHAETSGSRRSESVRTRSAVPRPETRPTISIPISLTHGIDGRYFWPRSVACIRNRRSIYGNDYLYPAENQKTRGAASFILGISQISGGSRTSVGGYCEPEPEDAQIQNSLTSAIPAHLTKLSAGLWKWITSQVFVPHVIG